MANSNVTMGEDGDMFVTNTSVGSNSTDAGGPGMTIGQYIDAVYAASQSMSIFQAGYIFERLNFWFLPPLALICNSLTLITMIRIKPFTSTSLYICSLAVSDTMILLLKMLYFALDIYEIALGDYGCGFLNFIQSTILHASIWMIVVMTFERFVAVIFPLRVNSLFTMRRTKLSILIIFLLFSLINAHFIYTYSQQLSPAVWVSYYCGHRKGTENWSYNIWFWINTALFAIIPCSILIAFNVSIILGMRASFKKQKKMVLDESNKKDAQQLQLTVMLLTMSFAYIIFFVPVCVFMISSIGFPVYESPPVFARFYFIASFVFFFSSLNHAMNFVFYFVSNRRFRSALYKVLRCQTTTRAKTYTGKSAGNTVNTVSSAVSNNSSGPASTSKL